MEADFGLAGVGCSCAIAFYLRVSSSSFSSSSAVGSLRGVMSINLGDDNLSTVEGASLPIGIFAIEKLIIPASAEGLVYTTLFSEGDEKTLPVIPIALRRAITLSVLLNAVTLMS